MKIQFLSILLFFAGIPSIYSQLQKSKPIRLPVADMPAAQLSNDVPLSIPPGENGLMELSSFDFYQRKTLPTISHSKELQHITLGIHGTPDWIEAMLPENLRSSGGDMRKEVKTWLNEFASIMHIRNPELGWKWISESQDVMGNWHIRMQQVYQNIPIHGAEIVLHGKEHVTHCNGNYIRTPQIATTIPALDEAQAKNQIGTWLQSKTKVHTLSNEVINKFTLGNSSPELCIYIDANQQPVLAWHQWVVPAIAERWSVYVDARTGNVLSGHNTTCKLHNHFQSRLQGGVSVTGKQCDDEHLEYNDLLSSCVDGPAQVSSLDLLNQSRTVNSYQIGSTYYMLDASRSMWNPGASKIPDDPAGAILTLDCFNTYPNNSNFKYDHVKNSTNAVNSWSKTAVSAHYNAGVAFEYFKAKHSRNSINGQGGTIVSLINVSDENGGGFDNAFWNGEAMFYGNGASDFKPLARGLDVAGHEMSHGVVQSTAGLQYQSESGALNESYADVFGRLIDSDDWRMGEDVVNLSAFPSGALRDLQNPHNGGSGLGDAGWQPADYSERYTGNQDNGGVHINSGIINRAFYLFASDAQVGLDKGGQVWYQALTKYLTKSSNFLNMRAAVIQSIKDLFGANSPLLSVAENAFNTVKVGSGGGSGGGTPTPTPKDLAKNPGTEHLLIGDEATGNLYLWDQTNPFIKISNSVLNSKPSISDDGTTCVFTANDKKIHVLTLNWTNGNITENILTSPDTWDNAAISKNGRFIAGVRTVAEPIIWVLDRTNGQLKQFKLYNPTFTSGVVTGDVQYADAMDFDYSGDYIMYDANNKLKQQNGNGYEYWDVSFLHFHDHALNLWAGGEISKLVSDIPDNTSIGNPVFSKNSPYIAAFDYIYDDGTIQKYFVLGANIETSDILDIVENDDLGYPSYNSTDTKVCFNTNAGNTYELNTIGVDATKIKGTGSIQNLFTGAFYGVYFSNGKRTLVNVQNIPDDGSITVYPNPASSHLYVKSQTMDIQSMKYTLSNMLGSILNQGTYNDHGIDVNQLASGTYLLQLIHEGKATTLRIIKE